MAELRFKRKKIKIFSYLTKTRLFVALFIIVFISLFVYNFFGLQKRRTYYTSVNEQTFPIIYQERNGRKINELRAFKDEKYIEALNDSLMILEDQRELNLLVYQKNLRIKEIEYEIRNKTTNELLERTKTVVPDDDEAHVECHIQNLIEEKTTYLMLIRCDIGDKKICYFTNILYKKKNNLDGALQFVTDFTEYSFDKGKMASLVKYFETNPNTDQKQMHSVSIESNFDQITWNDTGMQRVSDYLYRVYQAQDYCFNIDLHYLAKCKNGKDEEYFDVTDEYVARWDEKRFYIMKFDRHTEEILNIDNDIFDKDKKRFYLGITNTENLQKLESEEKKYMIFCKNKEVYEYDTENKTIQAIYGYKTRNNKEFIENNYKSAVKLLKVEDSGDAYFLVYGYNSNGSNEGLIGLSVWSYNKKDNTTIQNVFVPIYSSFQDLDYDIKKLCLLKDENLYFKSIDKIYSVDIINATTIALVENIEDTTSEGSRDSLHFAYNEMGENEKKVITVVNMEDISRNYIKAEDNEEIQVITYMNDDLFYGVRKKGDEWLEDEKTIGFPYKKIIAINSKNNETKTFEEEGYYYYNFLPTKGALHFNKYKRDGSHYKKETNDVVINNLVEEDEPIIKIGEEMNKRKMRIAYFEIDTEKKEIRKIMQNVLNVRNIEDEALNKNITKRPDVYYVYNNGTLKTKTKILTDGIEAIRDTYGYVKMNDKITCYNRSNKANLSYLREDDGIIENIKEFKENICLINDKILVMNLTGVTCRDVEYYISLGEKVACYKNDMFQFFITGYDNNNYVLEYENKERILTPRKEVEEVVEYGGYIIFGQLKNLE